MLIEANEVESQAKLSCDLCVLGGGAAGITLANELGGTGLDICVVEGGDFDYSDRNQELYRASDKDPIYPDPQWSRLRQWGGTSNHWGGSCSPLSEIDFEKRPFVQHSGWLIDRKDLDPFYERANVYCELGDYVSDNRFWISASEKQAPELTSARIQNGYTRPSPPTRFGEVWGSGVVRSKGVRVLTGANAVDMEYDGVSRTVNSIGIKSLDGNQFSISARVFVMCFGGIENARMLRYWNSKNNNQLGNQGDSVGRYFMDHPVVEGAFFLPTVPRSHFDFYGLNVIDGKRVAPFWELTPEMLRKHELTNIGMPFIPVSKIFASDGVSSFHILKDGDAAGNIWHHLRNVVGDLDMVLESAVRKKTGRKLKGSADDFAGYLFDTMFEQRPDRDNMVSLSSDVDELGIPRVDIRWQISETEKDDVWRAYRLVAEEVGRLGFGRMRLLKDREPRIWDSQLSFGSHHMGTTRMWKDPQHGAVDANLKVHGASNFYVAGSSVFPTGGHVPPTLTIVALAVRLADHLKDKLGST